MHVLIIIFTGGFGVLVYILAALFLAPYVAKAIGKLFLLICIVGVIVAMFSGNESQKEKQPAPIVEQQVVPIRISDNNGVVRTVTKGFSLGEKYLPVGTKLYILSRKNEYFDIEVDDNEKTFLLDVSQRTILENTK